MILRRLGNKRRIAKEIQKHFPAHKMYVEPFFGAGGMFFNKPKAKFNIMNDLDSDVYNLFRVVLNQKEELEKTFSMMPIHSDLFNYWKKNKEKEPVKAAVRFLFLSNFGYMGSTATMKLKNNNAKKLIINLINDTGKLLEDVEFCNTDFKRFIEIIPFRYNKERGETLIYNDPPYLGTQDNYSNSFTQSDSLDLFRVLADSGCKFAISEFDHPLIIEEAKIRNLNIIKIGERQNLKNRRTEILITNYKNQQLELFS